MDEYLDSIDRRYRRLYDVHEGHALVTIYKSERIHTKKHNQSSMGPTYELPDGTCIHLHESSMGYDFRRLPELLFVSPTCLYNHSLVLPFQTHIHASSASSSTTTTSSMQQLSIQELIHTSLSAVQDIDIRKELIHNIILTGSSSLFPNMEQRLSLELSSLLPGTYKNKAIASRDSVERRYAPWIGASILSSLGSFQQLWLSQKEYDEYGPLLSLQRFP